MTEREAIEKLKAYHKCQRLQVKGIYEDCNEKLCDNCDLCYMQGNTGEHIKSIEIAIQALEKQIAKKPVHDGYYDRIGIWHEWKGINGKPYELCPDCRTNLCCKMPYEKKPNFCDNCGQKLDWSDVD